ncbi:MAG: flagellar basal-body rod protein FlgF [Rhodospirillaceae bacterium]|nr:flagellar basal-body rod protein FlgF [Rhodospirillaceae bacterium]
MDNTTYIALSRQAALWNQLEVVANNLANVNTTGFKGTDTLFAQYVFRANSDDRTFKDKIAFTHDFGLVRNLSQGQFNFTNNTFDLALQGEGYFEIQGRNGGASTYTRAGNFTLDSTGRLVTQEGAAVMSINGQPITIPPNVGEVMIQGDGSIINKATNTTIDRIRVVRFDRERDLKQLTGTAFDANGQQPIDVPNPKVAQGVLEASNVNGISEMTRLIALNRAYGDVTKLVEEEHDRKRKASDLFSRQMSA